MDRSLVDILDRVNLVVQSVTHNLVECEDRVYTNYSALIECNLTSRQYTWTINRTYYEYQNLIQQVSEETHKSVSELGVLPPFSKFTSLSTSDQETHVLTILQHLLSSADTSRARALTAFFEVSYNSFNYERKYKEGYAEKIGSGKRSNQGRGCNGCKRVFWRRKRWFRVTALGLEYSNSHFELSTGEVIPFSKEFAISQGPGTGFLTGLRLVTSTHRITFRLRNTQELAEFERDIQEAYSESQYYNEDFRYDSSFVVRPNNSCQWFVDGASYFQAVLRALRNAQKRVYISDWWMSPEVYLARPAAEHPESQLVEVLGSLADRGVTVYVFLYKEVKYALSNNSLHTQKMLQTRSPHIQVLRHPYIGLRGGELLWSHHGKILLVDDEIGFLGGLDLCYGRYDTPQHSLVDTHLPHVWNHIDYSNVRVADFVNVADWQQSSIDRNRVPRMPWHDVAMTVRGEAVGDLEVHFKQLWNHAVRDITGSRDSNAVLPMKNPSRLGAARRGQKGAVYFDPGLMESRFLTKIHAAARDDQQQLPVQSSEMWIESRTIMPNRDAILAAKEALESKDEEVVRSRAGECGTFLREERTLSREGAGSCTCQLLRSCSLWSVGVEEPEHSIHDAYLWQIAGAKRFIYIENQFFISATAGQKVINQIGEALVQRILQAHFQNAPFLVIVVMPLLPGFEGSVQDSGASVLRVQLHYQFQTICRGPTSIYESLRRHGIDPKTYIRFYGLRTHGQLATPVTEMIYVHSKLMIVDDRTVIMGSANINDRSMVGFRDSEVALIVEDQRKVDAVLAGRRFKAGQFAHSLRLALFREHSGESTDAALLDPLHSRFNTVWSSRAATNTKLYRKVFRCYPDDKLQSIKDIPLFTRKQRLDLYEQLKHRIVGHLVEFPLKFLQADDLRLKMTKKEFYMPASTFT